MERDRLISLVTSVQQKEENAAAELFDAFYSDIYYHILKTVNNDSELAADLTQDTFVQILESIDQLEEPAAFVTWSQRIAFSKCTGYFKKKKELLVDENEDGYSIFDTQEETRDEFIPGEALDKEDLKQTIQAMINALPEEQKSALLLRYFNEISVKEIAEIQGVSEGTVKSRLNYARKALKSSVEEYEKKNDVKLHCAGVIPLLLWFFRAYRSSNGISLTATVASTAFESGVGTAAGSAAATATAATSTAATSTASIATGTATAITASAVTASGGVSTIAGILSTKVVAIIATAAVAIGGVSVGVSVVENRGDTQLQSVASGLEDTQMSFEEEDIPQEQFIGEENATDVYTEDNDNHIWVYDVLSSSPSGEEEGLLIRYRFCSKCFEYEFLFQKEGLSDCDHDWNNNSIVHETYIVDYRYCSWHDCLRHECFSIYKNTCQHQWRETTDSHAPYECTLCGCHRWTKPQGIIEEAEITTEIGDEESILSDARTEDYFETPDETVAEENIQDSTETTECDHDYTLVEEIEEGVSSISRHECTKCGAEMTITVTPVGSTDSLEIAAPNH